MGLFKFIKKIFNVSESPIKDSALSGDQIDSVSTDASGLTKKTSRKQSLKRGQSQSDPLTWQMYKTNPTRETDIVIGFDFGTSCTKVIIQDAVLKKAYAVRFNGLECAGNPYLLPTAIVVDQDGNLSLDQEGVMIDALKMNFIQQPDKPIKSPNGLILTAAEATSAYIGLVLREIRKWFWHEKYSDYKGVKIDWQLNVGMSSRSYDDQALTEQMKRVSLAGWNLTLKAVKSINVSEIKKAMVSADQQLTEGISDDDAQQLHPDNVCPIPEIIAQVVGYARSPMRQNGMYLIVDVGATTIDVSNFIIHENDGEDLYTILVAEVEKLGASILHKYRISCAEAIIRKHIDASEAVKFRQAALKTFNLAYDGISPLPKIEMHFPDLPNEAMKAFREKNYEFMAVCSKLVRKVIKESRLNRNPNSPAWQEGLPLFLCGGGSKIQTYKDVIHHAQKQLSQTTFPGFDRKQFPKPLNLETADIPPRDYHRMSVAYGLSFPCIDIGGIIPPGAVDDLVANEKIRNLNGYFIDKDMV